MKVRLLFLLLVSVVMVVTFQFLDQDQSLAESTLPSRTDIYAYPTATLAATPIFSSPLEQPDFRSYLPLVTK